MDLELAGKVAIVTGGNKGIGEAITRSFAAEGAIPMIVSRNREGGQALANEIASDGGQAGFCYAEMTSEEDIKNAVSQTLASFGRIDVVVNNAGVNDAVGLDAGVAAFRGSLEQNLVQFYSLVHHSLDALKRSKGCIVNIGSKVAETGQGGTSGYAAAKGGVNGLTREWALDLAEFGIRSNCVLPAETLTPQYQAWFDSQPDPAKSLKSISDLVPLGRRMTTSREIADTVVFVSSPRSSHTTGQLLYVDGGYTHFDRKCTV